MKLQKVILSVLLPLSLFSSEASVEQLFNVQTIKVKKENIQIKKEYYGYVKSEDNNIFDISPRFSGYVTKLFANKLYQKVDKGELLLNIYSPEVYKAKDEYLNSLIFSKNDKNKSILNSSKLKLNLLDINKNEIKKIKEGVRINETTQIFSPISGYIFKKNITNGSSFKSQSLLFKIVNLDKVWVELSIYEKDRIFLSNVEYFKLNFNGLKKEYKLTGNYKLYPNINKNNPTLTIRVEVENKDHKLFPGMYVIAKALKKGISFLTIPITSVIRKNSKKYVFVVGEYEGEYEPLEVEVEQINDNKYKVISGLEEGMEIVNNSLFMMDSDAQINGLY